MSDPRTGGADRRLSELLATLGLPATAGPAEVQHRRDELAAEVRTASDDLQEWTQQQLDDADAALALLRRRPADADGVAAPVEAPAASAVGQTEPVAEIAPDGYDDEPPLRRPATGRPAATRAGRGPRKLPGTVKALGAGVLAMGVLLGVYYAGADNPSQLPANHPPVTGGAAPAAASASPTPVNDAEIAALKAKVAADPTDVASLSKLATLYAGAQNWPEAIGWQNKVVAAKPTSADELCILGAFQFNSGDPKTAEQTWIKATQVDPKSQEAYYDLGILYIISDPPQPEKTTQMWQKVIDIDPTTPLAKRAAQHLPNVAAVEASPSASPSR